MGVYINTEYWPEYSFKVFQVSLKNFLKKDLSYLSSLVSDFRWLLRTSFLFSLLFMFQVFSFFLIYLFWHIFKLRNLFSFICFFKSLPRILSSLSVSYWTWFSSPMCMFNSRALARKLKLLVFSPNWEIRLVFMESGHHGWR